MTASAFGWRPSGACARGRISQLADPRARPWRLLDLDIARPPGKAGTQRTLLAQRPHDRAVPHLQPARDGPDGVAGAVQAKCAVALPAVRERAGALAFCRGGGRRRGPPWCARGLGPLRAGRTRRTSRTSPGQCSWRCRGSRAARRAGRPARPARLLAWPCERGWARGGRGGPPRRPAAPAGAPAAIISSRAGRRSRRPDTPASVNSTASTPRRCAYSRRGSSWASGCWSPVLTRA